MTSVGLFARTSWYLAIASSYCPLSCSSTPARIVASCSVVVFAGTRVPVQALLDYLEGGDSLDDFLMDFPSVTREHAIAVLEAAKSALLAQTSAA